MKVINHTNVNTRLLRNAMRFVVARWVPLGPAQTQHKLTVDRVIFNCYSITFADHAFAETWQWGMYYRLNRISVGLPERYGADPTVNLIYDLVCGLWWCLAATESGANTGTTPKGGLDYWRHPAGAAFLANGPTKLIREWQWGTKPAKTKRGARARN